MNNIIYPSLLTGMGYNTKSSLMWENPNVYTRPKDNNCPGPATVSIVGIDMTTDSQSLVQWAEVQPWATVSRDRALQRIYFPRLRFCLQKGPQLSSTPLGDGDTTER